MKKILVKLLACLLLISIVGCTPKEETPVEPANTTVDVETPENSDDCETNPKGCDVGNATNHSVNKTDFKTYYESMNGVANSQGKIHREVHVDENNVFEIVDQEKLIELLNSGEGFYLYVGDTKCPWCRLQLESAVKVTNELGVDKVYSINIWDEEGNEVFRDKCTFTDVDDEPVQSVEPSEAYSMILKMDVNDLLSNYTLTKDDVTIDVGEERIYAPNYLYIENNEIVKFCSPTPDGVEDPRGEISAEQYAEIENNLVNFFLN